MKQRKTDAWKSSLLNYPILKPLLLISLQLIFLRYIFLHQKVGIWSLVINLGMLIIILVMNLVLIYQKVVQRKKAVLEAQLKEYEFMEQLNKKRLLADKEKKADEEHLRESLRKQLESVRQAVENLDKKDNDVSLASYQTQEKRKDRAEDYCANAMANIVLREKAKECVQQEICFQAEVNIPQILNISDYHLCSIFSNLIDNATEACRELPKEERRISVTANIYGAYLYIQIRNNCTAEHARRPKRKGRGMGMKIIEQIVEKYGGDCSAEFKDGEYQADVVVGI